MNHEEALALDRKNEELVELEERQFQEYANKVITHAEKGGRNTYPLRKAAKEGAGGGLGKVSMTRRLSSFNEKVNGKIQRFERMWL